MKFRVRELSNGLFLGEFRSFLFWQPIPRLKEFRFDFDYPYRHSLAEAKKDVEWWKELQNIPTTKRIYNE